MADIYTRSGDDGSTGLFDGTRVPKDHPRCDVRVMKPPCPQPKPPHPITSTTNKSADESTTKPQFFQWPAKTCDAATTSSKVSATPRSKNPTRPDPNHPNYSPKPRGHTPGRRTEAFQHPNR